jgi:hypothetical protein
MGAVLQAAAVHKVTGGRDDGVQPLRNLQIVQLPLQTRNTMDNRRTKKQGAGGKGCEAQDGSNDTLAAASCKAW